MKWLEMSCKPVRFGIGLTAGASCTGIDAALVRLKGNGIGVHIKLAASNQFPYPKGLRNRLLAVQKSAKELAMLHFELGEAFAEAAQAMKVAASEAMLEPDFIALQGYPAAFLPRRGGSKALGALSLGEPAIVAERAKLPVASEFTARDMATGGQGRPYDAYANWLLFARETRTIACLHLGALASITIVTPELDNVMAFDIGPCNAALDGAIHLILKGNREYDLDGATALQGEIIEEMLEELLRHPYFNLVPPKSASRDDFHPETYLRDAIKQWREQGMEHIMATVTMAVAKSIERAYLRFIKPRYNLERIIITGGGTLNKALVRNVKDIFPDLVRKSSEYGLPPETVDALRVAVLGNETFCGKANNTPSATGADRSIISGSITMY